MVAIVGTQDGFVEEVSVTSPDVLAAQPAPEPRWLPVERPVEALVEDVSLVAPNQHVYIFCGEAHRTSTTIRTF